MALIKLKIQTSPIPQIPIQKIMSPPPSPDTPRSSIMDSAVSTTGSGKWGPPPTPREAMTAIQLTETLKEGLEPLGNAFDVLGEQIAHIALLGGDERSAQAFNQLRQKMKDQEKKQEEGIHEITLLLNDILQSQIIDHLREQIEKEIEEQIDTLVQEEVAKQLEKHVPQALQEEFATSKKELDEARRALHNSESRRSNAALKSDYADGSLKTILMMDGNVSSVYPKDLQSLFDLDAEAAKQLIIDYELPDGPSEVRKNNVNRIMHFVGVRYQLDRIGVGEHAAEYRLLSPVTLRQRGSI